MAKQTKKQIEADTKQEIERLEILNNLADKITKLFQQRAKDRKAKEQEWADCQRLYNAPLNGSNVELGETPFDSSARRRRRPEPNIVRTKCDTAVANSVSMQFAAGEKNWDLFPPANNTDPMAAEKCRLMEREIEHQLSQAKYGLHSRRAMEDRVILGTGVLKGPVNTGHMAISYQPAGDQWLPQVTAARTPKITHVPLWRFYPDMSVADFSEVQDAIEVHPIRANQLAALMEHPGFDDKAIHAILYGDAKAEGIRPAAYNDSMLNLPADLWARNPYLYKDRYVVLEYHGPVSYDEVEKLGLEPTYESPTRQYYGEVWVCCGRVIRMELENIEGYCETPYSVSVWKRDPTSVFGFGHPMLLADSQRVVTQSYHMILDNASLTSGPQVAMYQRYIQPIDGNWNLSPNKVWLLTDPSATVNNAIQFFTPTNVIGQIMPVLELARGLAEEESATLATPTQSPDNSETATGQLIMKHMANTNLDFAAEEWDDQVTEKTIRRMYAWNMQYNPKNEIKGDYSVDVRSSSEYKNKQMYIRDLERLQMESAQNPQMAMVLDTKELTKARLALMHLPDNRIIRSDEEIAAAEQQMAQQPNPEMLQIQIKQMELEVKKQELQLKAHQLQFEMQQQQQRELWEHEEKMGSNQARMAEAQASVLKARSEAEVEMIKLASKDKQFMSKLMSDREIAQLKLSSQAFLASMAQAEKADQNSLYAQELEIKRDTGSGI